MTNISNDSMQNHNINIEELTSNWTQAQPIVAAFISSLVPNWNQADDILQEVALVIVRKYQEYDPSRPFQTWAIGIARNEILMFRRKQSRDRHTFDDSILDQITERYQDKASELEQMKRALGYCIAQLQPRWKKILEMRYSMGLKVKDLAQQMGINVNTALNALHRIRLALRKCVQRRLAMQES